MDEMNTLLHDGDKYADAIQKLQTMELEWFDLRFSEYTSFNGLSIARIMARETLRRLTRRHDAIQVTKLWNRDPNSQSGRREFYVFLQVLGGGFPHGRESGGSGPRSPAQRGRGLYLLGLIGRGFVESLDHGSRAW